MGQKISHYYPPWIDFLTLMVLILIYIYSYGNYALLPEQIPTHFNFYGLPDSWHGKSWATVYLLPGIGTICWLGITLMNYFLIITSADPRKYINLPMKRKENLSPEQMEAVRKVTAPGMMIINVTVVAMITIIQYGMIQTALGRQTGLNVIILLVLVIAIILESVILTIKLYKIT